MELNKKATASNDLDAQALREELRMRGIFLINLMSAAGSGKTTLLSRTITDLRGRVSIGVMEADIASDVDAETIEALGAKSIQVHTGGCCHMDAAMTRESLEAFDAEGTEIIFLENVGNLICPAEFDTGAHLKVMILSLPEGDDKPLKYPLMFQESDALIITKMDAAPYFDFDLDAACRRAKALNPDIEIFPVSAKTGEGMDAWENWLLKQLKER
ncbi:MAG: hydrogenase nickel incorporation protein HypB [Lachnospiraceae bacterium]|nr:hydrogenase nickel incorporation protein HypB [Lachnospiraceae bacterium]